MSVDDLALEQWESSVARGKSIQDEAAKRRFKAAWEYGVSVEDLGERFGLSYEGVLSTARRLGLKQRFGKWTYIGGTKDAEIVGG